MKRLFTALLSAALLLSLAACGGNGSSGSANSGSAAASSASLEETPPAESLPFTLAWYPEFSLHPTLAANRANLTLAPLLYESLFTVDAAFQAQPVLCQSYTVSEDKLVWTFTLRAGITFSDGTPLTAQEAADALNLARSAGSRYQERLSDVTAVTPSEANPYQFTITLRRANGPAAGHPHRPGPGGPPRRNRPLRAGRRRARPHRPKRLVAERKIHAGLHHPSAGRHQERRADLRL